MTLLLLVIHWALLLFLIALTLRALLGWVPTFVRDWEPRGGLRVLAELVLTITDPPVRALRKVVPPLRVGEVSLDLGFSLLYLAVLLLLGWI